MRVLWMQECDPGTVRARAGRVVNRRVSRGPGVFQRLGDVGDGKGDVVDPFPRPFEKPGDDAIVGERLQEFDLGFPNGHEGNGHPVCWQVFA